MKKVGFPFIFLVGTKGRGTSKLKIEEVEFVSL
jgi:hypothetical protein